MAAWLLFSVLVSPALALRAPNNPAAASSKPRLTFVLILARHGVRAPSSPPGALHRYSVRAWPSWPVAPDYLTPHGYKLLRQFGEWDRAWLARQNLLPPSGCEAPFIFIYTDSDERTIQSGHALAAGLSPACALTIHSRPEGHRDPVFHFPPATLDAVTRAAMLASIRERMGGSARAFTAAHQSELHLLQSVLNGCKPNTSCATTPGQPLLRLHAIRASVNITPQGEVSLHGPVFKGASLAEDILLEYTQGMPSNNVAWGLLDATQMREIIALHTAEFAVKHRTPALARVEMSNLLSHILDTLQQAVQSRPVSGAWGTPAQKLVLIDGHDTNIAAIAGLLHLHWTLDGRRDDTPPGSQLQFLVYRGPGGAAQIRVRIVMQTLRQMRDAATLTSLHPPASATLNLAGCTMKKCSGIASWKSFDKAARSAIDTRFVLPFSQP
jgi:4-phytase/acid phosphatase